MDAIPVKSGAARIPCCPGRFDGNCEGKRCQFCCLLSGLLLNSAACRMDSLKGVVLAWWRQPVPAQDSRVHQRVPARIPKSKVACLHARSDDVAPVTAKCDEVSTMQHAPSVPCLLQSNRQTLPKKSQRADNERRVTVNIVAAPGMLLLPHTPHAPQSPTLSCASPLSVSPLHSLLPTPTGSPFSSPRGSPYSPNTSPIPIRPCQGYLSRSAGQLPAAPLPFPSLLAQRPPSPSESPSCQGGGAKELSGRNSFEVRDFSLGMMVFDPANPALRAQLLATLGASPQSTFEAMRGFHGGMNEGTLVEHEIYIHLT